MVKGLTNDGGSTRRWRRLRQLILTRDHNVCAYCGGTATTVDHVIPRALLRDRPGMADHPSNLVAACSRCNRTKGTKTVMPEKVGQKEGPFFYGDASADRPNCPLSPPAEKPPDQAKWGIRRTVRYRRDGSELGLQDPGPLGRAVTR